MKLQKSRKGMTIVTAAVLMFTTVSTVILGIKKVAAIEDKKALADAHAQTEKSVMNGWDSESERSSSWWKATLSDYDKKLSLVSYETVETPTEPTESRPAKGVVVNDTGISYIEPHSDYQAIQIVPADSLSGSTGTSYNYGSHRLPYSSGGGLEQQSPQSAPINSDPGTFVFTTYGYGHGVGMSQNGANHYASYSGWNYEQILGHYYPGTYIQKRSIKPEDKISAGGVNGTVLDIVSMVTYNEVGGSMAVEAIKAQAVAAYTYIMYKDGNAPDLCPKSNPPQNVIDAVNSVLGEAIFYNGGYALTMFGASSGGSTASCKDIFYQDIPYLISVPCEYDSQCDPHYATTEIIRMEDVKDKLESNLGITLSDDPSNWISVTEGDGGYVASAVIDGQVTIKGYELRNYLGLKSPKFAVKYYS